jgi:hypothetical protein
MRSACKLIALTGLRLFRARRYPASTDSSTATTTAATAAFRACANNASTSRSDVDTATAPPRSVAGSGAP